MSSPAKIARPALRHRHSGRFTEAMNTLLRHNRLALFSLILILLFFLAAALAPVIAPYGENDMDLMNRLAPPSREHLLGTDEGGRDILTRLLYGSRVSLLVGVVPTLLSMLLGAALGILAGFSGGRTDAVIMRLADIDYFMTTKISWSEMDRLPFDTFLWQGIDGSEVIAALEEKGLEALEVLEGEDWRAVEARLK